MTSAQDPRAVSITLEARPVLSYVMAHNEIPVISRLAIDHVARDVPAARLRLEVAVAGGPIGEAQEILFSTAFSVNDKGVLPLNFGPLNRAGGERRLNVAVTRARRQVIVFSSFDPAQLRTEETSSIGLKHLRTYLAMAARGPGVLPRDTSSRIVRDRHREDIAARLRERGLTVRTNVGLSDFVIDLVLGEPDDPRVAVLLDGPAWASRLTARDRDALPQEVLVDVLGWPAVERVWLPTWLADPDAVVVRLATVAAQADGRSPAGSGPPARVEAAPPGPRHAAKNEPTPQPERPAAPVFAAAALARPDLIPLREIVNAMAGVARAAAGAERGDLHREVLAAFGWKRRTAGVTERLDLALDLGVRAGRLRFDGEIVVSASGQ